MALQHDLEQFFYQLSGYCDEQDWDRYVAQFAPDCELHIPQWDSEHRYTQDPKTEMSLMYYPNRGGLEDRVFRIRTGKSAASNPMPRTLHLINNVRLTELEGGEVQAKVNWVTHYYRFGEASNFFGVAHYRLRQEQGSWLITYKQSILFNDKINAVLDFYHV